MRSTNSVSTPDKLPDFEKQGYSIINDQILVIILLINNKYCAFFDKNFKTASTELFPISILAHMNQMVIQFEFDYIRFDNYEATSSGLVVTPQLLLRFPFCALFRHTCEPPQFVPTDNFCL
jgi:hypothetical protein